MSAESGEGIDILLGQVFSLLFGLGFDDLIKVLANHGFLMFEQLLDSGRDSELVPFLFGLGELLEEVWFFHMLNI